MKWFKHDSDASSDAKIKKLIIRHGAVGYAVYFHCLELISSGLKESNLTFELEHDSEIIADNLKIQGNGMSAGVDIVNKIMTTIIELNLFQSSNNRIFCTKLAKRLDSSMTSNPKFRKLIQKSHDNIMIESLSNHDTVMQEEIRKDKKRIDKTRKEKTFPPTFSSFVKNEPKVEEFTKQESLPDQIAKAIKNWNSKENLPVCRYTIFNLPNVGEINTKFDVFGLDIINQGINNLNKYIKHEKYKPTSFDRFITNSIDRWIDDSKPWERYEDESSDDEAMDIIKTISQE